MQKKRRFERFLLPKHNEQIDCKTSRSEKMFRNHIVNIRKFLKGLESGMRIVGESMFLTMKKAETKDRAIPTRHFVIFRETP